MDGVANGLSYDFYWLILFDFGSQRRVRSASENKRCQLERWRESQRALLPKRGSTGEEKKNDYNGPAIDVMRRVGGAGRRLKPSEAIESRSLGLASL